jgi:hypothetical protein
MNTPQASPIAYEVYWLQDAGQPQLARKADNSFCLLTAAYAIGSAGPVPDLNNEINKAQNHDSKGTPPSVQNTYCHRRRGSSWIFAMRGVKH